MREIRSSGSVEGVMGNHDSYSDSCTKTQDRGFLNSHSLQHGSESRRLAEFFAHQLKRSTCAQ